MTEYSRDRFDDVPEYTDRKGGHRDRFEPPNETAGLRAIGIAAAIALATGAFSYFVLPGLLDRSAEASSSPTTSASSAAATSASASAAANGSVSATPDGAPAVDPNDTVAAVEVYNASTTAGLETQASEEIRAGGIPVAGVGPWRGFAVTESAVYYSQGAQTAQDVAVMLGLPAIEDERMPGVVVVLADPR